MVVSGNGASRAATGDVVVLAVRPASCVVVAFPAARCVAVDAEARGFTEVVREVVGAAWVLAAVGDVTDGVTALVDVDSGPADGS